MPELFNDDDCRDLAIRHLWFFVTETCNLRCSYCFYRHRSKGKNLRLNYIPAVFDYFNNAGEAKFVISGGETLTDWPKTKQVIDCLRHLDGRKYILLQTNATLLDTSKIGFLKDRCVHIEVGLDGRGPANKHRKGLDPHLKRIEKNILLAGKIGINVHATMTVCPDQVRSMTENLLYLLGLNIKKIEVTPAAFANWKKEDAYAFKDIYLTIMKFLLKNRRTGIIGTEYDAPLKKNSIDIILMPDGTILTNWALLVLPKSLKSRYCMFKIINGQVMVNKDLPADFCADYEYLFKKQLCTTYRELSTRYAQWAWRHLGTRRWQGSFRHYAEVCNFLKTVHQKLLI